MNLLIKTTQITSFTLLLNHLRFLFSLLISITPSSLATTYGCHQEERKALLNIKSSLEDPSGRLSTWKEGVQHRNCCDWHGIKYSDESLHVVSIDLRNTDLEDYMNGFSYRDGDHFYPPITRTSLRGKLSRSLFNITHLEYLDLGFNGFQESDITLQFSNLTKLTHLDLSFSNFSGLIATQFSNLTFLQYLDISCFFQYGGIDFLSSNYYKTSCLESSSIK